MSDIQVQYQGFHPAEFTEAYVDVKLAELLERAPYGSTIRATISRDGHWLKARVTVHSAAGEFFAIARGRRLREVGRKAFHQLSKQLERWKDDRHGGRDHGSHVA